MLAPRPIDDTARRLVMSDELEVLFNRHFGDVFRYLSRRVGVHVAEDLAAETFAIAIQQQGSYDPSRGPLRPWLFGIATNLVRQHARSEEVHLRALARLRQELSTRPMMVEEEARVNFEGTVAEALLQLREQDRSLICLVDGVGLSYREAAHELELPIGTVRSRLFRVRRKLRAALHETGITQWDIL